MKLAYAVAAVVSTFVSISQAQSQPPEPPRNTGKVYSNTGSVTQCYNHVARCIIPVYVHAEGATGCSAWIDPEMILVPLPDTTKIAKIKVVWVLRKGDKATHLRQFLFDAATGINPNSTTDQFKSEGYDDADGDTDADDPATSKQTRFRWASTNPAVGGTVNYTPNVWRITGSSAHPIPVKCAASDPTISNDY